MLRCFFLLQKPSLIDRCNVVQEDGGADGGRHPRGERGQPELHHGQLQ